MESIQGNNQVAHIAAQNQSGFNMQRLGDKMQNGRATGGDGNGILATGFGVGSIFNSGRVSELVKKPKKGPANYPSSFYYKLDEWIDLYQDSWVRIKFKRSNPVLSKNRIFGKINLSIENKTSSALSKVTVKVKTNPPSKLD